jgi:hypothetical protein
MIKCCFCSCRGPKKNNTKNPSKKARRLLRRRRSQSPSISDQEILEEIPVNHVSFAKASRPQILTFLPIVMTLICHASQAEFAFPYIPISLSGVSTCSFLDSGAGLSYCRLSFAKRLPVPIGPVLAQPARTANGSELKFIGSLDSVLTIGGLSTPIKLHVSADSDCPCEALIGNNAIYAFNKQGKSVSFNLYNQIGKSRIPFYKKPSDVPLEPQVLTVRVYETTVLRPRTETLLWGRIEGPLPRKGNYLVSPLVPSTFGSPDNFSVASVLASPESGNRFPLSILNATNTHFVLHQNRAVAEAQLVEPSNIFSIEQETKKDTVEQEIKKDALEFSSYIPKEIDYAARLPPLASDFKKPPIETADFSSPLLTDALRTKLRNLIFKYGKAFYGFVNDDYGCYTGKETYKIFLRPNAIPKRLAPYRIPFDVEDEVIRQLKELLKHQIVRKSSSAWGAPLMIVRRNNSSTPRLVYNYSYLNQNTVPMCHYLPRISEIQQKVAGSTLFSTVDFAHAFSHCQIYEPHRYLTAFVSPLGLLEHNRVSFGLMNAPTFFHQLAAEIFGSLKSKSFIYIDDLIIPSDTPEQNLEHLEEVFQLTEKAGLKIQLSKCKFMQKSVLYLGLIVSDQGLQINPDNIAKIANFEPPTNKAQLMSLLGVLGYLRKFCFNYSAIAKSLTVLLQEKTPWVWGKEQQESFEKLKYALTHPPVLKHAELDKPFFTINDASPWAVSSILSQLDAQNRLRPIQYASRALNSHESRYCHTEKECLSICFGLHEFRGFISNQEVTCITDCKALRSLLSIKQASSRLQKFQLTIASYRANILFSPGKYNKAADYLSRSPALKPPEEKLPEPTYIASVHPILGTIFTRNEIREALENDDFYGKLTKYLQTGEEPANLKFLTEYKKIAQFFLVQDNLLYRRASLRSQKILLYIPYPLRKLLIEFFHGNSFIGAHAGQKRTLAKIQSRFWYPGLAEDTIQLVKSCPRCQERKSNPHHIFKQPLSQLPRVTRVMETVHIDTVGPFSVPLPVPGITVGNARWIFTACDSLSKYVFVSAIENQNAETVANVLITEICCKFGIMENIVSDRGGTFISDVWREMLKILGVKHLKTSGYNPACNGQIERNHRVLIDSLSSAIDQHPDRPWQVIINYVAYALNTSYCRVIRNLPFVIVFNRLPILPTDLVFQNFNLSLPLTESDHKTAISRGFLDSWAACSENIEREKIERKKYYDEKNDVAVHTYEKGDFILIRYPKTDKLCRPFKGPFVIKNVSLPTLLVQHCAHPSAVPFIVNANRTRPYFSSTVLPFRRHDAPLLPPDTESEGESETECDPAEKTAEKTNTAQEKQEIAKTTDGQAGPPVLSADPQPRRSTRLKEKSEAVQRAHPGAPL